MGTNYYFRKKTFDPTRIDAIADGLNDEFKALVAKYNERLHKAYSEMGIDSYYDFDDDRTFYSPIRNADYDIHVGKLSHGWKPLLQAGDHFNSITTLKQWHEQNKHDYNFIDEYRDEASFEDFLAEIAKRNKDENAKNHERVQTTDGYDWMYTKFS